MGLNCFAPFDKEHGSKWALLPEEASRMMNRRTMLMLGGSAVLLAGCASSIGGGPQLGADGKPLPQVYNMAAQGAGTIVNTASAAGLVHPPRMSEYNAVKAAVVGKIMGADHPVGLVLASELEAHSKALIASQVQQQG